LQINQMNISLVVALVFKQLSPIKNYFPLCVKGFFIFTRAIA
jgi:hypothetical protein